MASQIEFLIDVFPDLVLGFPNRRPGGLLLSIVLAVVGIGLGFAVAVPVGTATGSSLGPIRALAHGYVRIIRGIPLVLLLLIIHLPLGGGRFGFESSSLTSALVTLVLYSSSYQAGIVASGLRSVPPALVEDARLMGATRFGAWWSVRLPYALRVMRPAFTNQAISLFKDTSVVVVLGVADLTTTARIALGSDVDNAPFWVATYLAVGVLYFIVAYGGAAIAGRYHPPRL